MIEQPRGGLSAAVRMAFNIARYRILQRTVMVSCYFSFGEKEAKAKLFVLYPKNKTFKSFIFHPKLLSSNCGDQSF